MGQVRGRRVADRGVGLEEADPAHGRGPDDDHDRDQGVALPVVPAHLAEGARRGERDEQQEEDDEQVREPVRVLERVRGVGVEEAAAVVAQVLDALHRAHRAAGDRLVHPGQGVDRLVGVEVVDGAARDEDDGTDDGQRQQQPEHRPGDVHPEVAQLVGARPGEAPDHRDRHHQADRGGHELLHRQAGHLGQVAHGRLARVVLPVRIGYERGRGVPGRGRRHVGHALAQQQEVLEPLEAVQEQHAHGREGQDAAHIGRPPLVGLGVDAHQPGDEALDAPVLVTGEYARDVVAEGHVARGESGDQQRELQTSRQRCCSSEPLRLNEGHE